MQKKIQLLVTALAVFIVLSFSGKVFSQEEKKTETISIQTSAVCNMCKERLESKMAFVKGVTGVQLDNKTKVLSVTYKPEKTSPEKLRTAVTKIGYNADEMPADKKAYNRLPACCKKDNAPH